MRRMLGLIFLVVFLPSSAFAVATKKYVADFRALFTPANAAQNNAAIQFIIDGSGVRNGLQPQDISISILRGSRLQSSLDPGQTLKITPIMGGDLLVQIVGDIRSPTLNTQDVRFRIVIERENVKSLRIRQPRWGDSDPANNHDFDPLGSAALTGGRFVLDPHFIGFNDLVDMPLTIQNLEFAHNLTEASLDLLDLDALFDAPLNLSLPRFTLSPGTNSEDLGLLLDAGPDPDPELFLVAMGQVLDPASGEKVGVFVHAIQGVPEPGGWLIGLALAVCAALAVVRASSRNRAMSR